MYRRPPEKIEKPPTFSKAWWQVKPNLPEAFVQALSIYAIGTLLALLVQVRLKGMGGGLPLAAFLPLLVGAGYSLKGWMLSWGNWDQSNTRMKLFFTHAAVCALGVAMSFS